jgi:hypothetical protein
MRTKARRESAGPEDKIPDPTSGLVVSRIGDLWELGRHCLSCGDARDELTYEKLFDGEKAQIVFTDTPCDLGGVRHREFAMASAEMTPEAFTKFLTSVFNRLAAHTTDGAVHYICADWRHIAEMTAAGNAAYSELKNLCIWTKANDGMHSLYRGRTMSELV